MNKIIFLLLYLVALVFAETHLMRIGDSQYFDTRDDLEHRVKVTLLDVQNGVAVLKKEPVQQQIPSVNYYYFAPNMSVVAPIELQPYPAIVTSDYVDIRGICEPGKKIYLYETSGKKLFSKSVLSKTQNFAYDNGSFAIRLPLNEGENNFFFSYASDIIGTRAMATITREDPPADLLSVDLDPVGSVDVRKTNVIVQNVKNGSLIGIESILGSPFSRTDKKNDVGGNVLFEMDNSYTEAFERNFHVMLLNEENNMISHNTIVLPVNDKKPSCLINSDVTVFSSSFTLEGSYASSQGVRFVWARILDSDGIEYGRMYTDLGKRFDGVFSVGYNSSDLITLRTGDKNGGVISQSYMKIPIEELNNGVEYNVEIGVTDISGNRSNTYVYALSESAFEKVIDISLLEGVPTTSLYNYPILVELNSKNFDFSKVLETGDDISFFDVSGRRLLAEKEYFSKKDKTGFFWVNIPFISALSSSVRLKVKWDNPLAEPASGENTWNERYTGVYHFNERYIGPYVPRVSYSDYVIYATGSFVYGERCEINGSYKMNGDMPINVGTVPNPSSQDILLFADGSLSLIPGMYGDVVLEPRSKLNLRTGTYHFKSLTIRSDASVNADVVNGVVDIKVKENLKIDDRGSLNALKNADVSAVRIEVLGPSVSIERDVSWNGVLSAPNASVQVLERTVWNGTIYAKNVEFGSDVSVNAVKIKNAYAYTLDEQTIFPSTSVLGYGIYAKNSVSIESASKITSAIGSEGNVTIGDNVVIYGNLMAWNDVVLKNHSSLIGDAIVGGTVKGNSNANWNGNSVPLVEMVELDIPIESAQIGSEQVEIPNEKIVVLSPGVYADLHVNNRGKIYLQDGTYYFSSLNMACDAEMSFAEGATNATIVISGSLNISDRVKINQKGLPLVFNVTGDEGTLIGGDCQITARIIAPNSDLVMNDRTLFNGSVWAKKVNLGHDVVFYNELPYSSNTSIDISVAAIKSDWISDATKSKNNGLPHFAYSKGEFIASYEYFKNAGNVFFKEYPYFGAQEGTVSAWLYFDGVSGRFAASSDSPFPDWELVRTLEGNILVSVKGGKIFVPVPEESWVFFAVSFDKEYINVYLNGELVGHGLSKSMGEKFSPWVGKNGDGIMKMDELRFSNVARDASWIRVDYITQKQNHVETGVSEYALVF